ncbi:MAG TPA: enoyl-CoA hydratase-related protein [Thermoplasmata archaeon]|nr:enoyl-CoA hydratase-related protein [Thermoplasmata archaeon]
MPDPVGEVAGIRTERRGAVLGITIDRPDRLNALDIPSMIELRRTVQSATVNREVRAVLLTGAGRAFCAGGDVATMEEHRARGDLTPLFHELTGEQETTVRELLTMPKPVVAALPGVAAGGGLSLALACDWRIASEKALLVPAFPSLGAVPDGGLTYFLPHYLGIGLAQEMLFTNARLSATRAKELGLVHEVVEPDQLAERAWARAEELAQGPTFAYGWMKRLMVSAFSASLETQLRLERRGMVEATEHGELPEGIRAFHEKRPPRFPPPT